jgi:hypothetical protein
MQPRPIPQCGNPGLITRAKCSLNVTKCSLNVTKCSLNVTKCSLTDVLCSPKQTRPIPACETVTHSSLEMEIADGFQCFNVRGPWLIVLPFSRFRYLEFSALGFYQTLPS